jgi:hypothetical protein
MSYMHFRDKALLRVYSTFLESHIRWLSIFLFQPTDTDICKISYIQYPNVQKIMKLTEKLLDIASVCDFTLYIIDF